MLHCQFLIITVVALTTSLTLDSSTANEIIVRQGYTNPAAANSSETFTIWNSPQLPIMQKSRMSPIRINSRGIVGYKRLSKKYKDDWTSAPRSTSFSIKRNRIYTTPENENKTSKIVPYKYLSNDLNSADIESNPPPPDQVAKMARYVVRTSDWLSLSTISTREHILGFPFTNVFSTSDGPEGMSSGNPYMYMTPLDMSVIDLQQDPRASMAMTLAQGNYCEMHKYDPEDPRCARVILSGNIVKIPANTTEDEFAKSSLFYRHPDMEDWPKDHGFFCAKLNISSILVLDFFGGVKTVTPEDYFKITL